MWEYENYSKEDWRKFNADEKSHRSCKKKRKGTLLQGSKIENSTKEKSSEKFVYNISKILDFVFNLLAICGS